MPKINIESNSADSADSTYNKVKEFLNSVDEIKSLDPEFCIDFDDASRSGKAKGKVFAAEICVKENGSGCSVALVIDLPMKYGLMKGMIQSKIQGKLDKALG